MKPVCPTARWPLAACLLVLLGLVLLGRAGPVAAAPEAPAGAALNAASLAPLPTKAWTPAAAAHLLRRAGFGGTPAEVATLYGRGLQGAVDYLVHYERIDNRDRPALEVTVSDRPPRGTYRGKSEEERRQIRNAYRRKDRQQFQRHQEWWLRSMISTPRPLEERMTFFWHGHFTSSMRTVRNSYHMLQQNELLREHATGSFDELLHGISRDPAMLRYLDGNRSRKGKPNENYAREVMELFTMGEGHYTEEDIQAGARAFTGWTFRNNEFVNVPRQHDAGEKTFLGKTGSWNGDDVLDIILAQEATPKHVARKLFQYFAHDEPSAEVVDGLAQVLLASDYQLKPMLTVLFRSAAFYASASRATHVKSPVVLVVSLFRTLGIQPTRQARLSQATQVLGQAILEPPTVKGWDGGMSWITTSHLLNRYNLASAVVGTAKDQRELMRQERERVLTRRQERQAKARAAKSRELGRRGAGEGGMDGPGEMEGGGEMGSDEMDAEKKAKARRPAGRNAMRFLQRLRMTTPFDPVDYARTHGLTTAAAYVDFLGTALLAAPLEPEPRASLVAYLEADGPLDPTRREAEARLRGALKLLVSTPEFQLN